MKDLKTVLSTIVKRAKEKKKISCFFIGNTKKKKIEIIILLQLEKMKDLFFQVALFLMTA